MIRLRAIDHLVLRVKDMDMMQRFYCEVLGAELVAHRPDFDMVHLRAGTSLVDMVSVDGKSGRAGGAAPGKEGRNVDHFCFRVEPFEKDGIIAHLEKHRVRLGPVRERYGAEGNGWSIYLTDPEGNTVELKGPSDGKGPPPPKGTK
jgi:catechol 2,3-dioxygenase-like lactoylglutathione lyase family enzyme